jgi:hypothetical protein
MKTMDDGKMQRYLQVIQPYEKFQEEEMNEKNVIVDKQPSRLVCESTFEQQLYNVILDSRQEGVTAKVRFFFLSKLNK